jgi:hypothetical protein
MNVSKAIGANNPATLHITIPLGLREEDALVTLIDGQTGVLVASRKGRIRTIGALEGYRGSSALGIRIGTPDYRVEKAYGAPSRQVEISGGDFWVYPERDMAFLLIGGRVDSWWLVSMDSSK